DRADDDVRRRSGGSKIGRARAQAQTAATSGQRLRPDREHDILRLLRSEVDGRQRHYRADRQADFKFAVLHSGCAIEPDAHRRAGRIACWRGWDGAWVLEPTAIDRAKIHPQSVSAE